jgi:hypothetical protein
MEQRERELPAEPGVQPSIFDDAGSGAASGALGGLLTAFREVVSRVSQDSERYVRSSAQHGAQ